eukprot:gene11360-21552_t
MKSLILLCVIVAASAEDFHMNLTENGETFTQDIIVDVQGNTEEIKVPRHQDAPAVNVLNDFNIGLSAVKLSNSRRCFISKIHASEQRPAELKQSMATVRSQFPRERYMVETFNVLTVRKMVKDEVGEKIAGFCNGYDLFYTMRFNKENIEEEVIKMIKSARDKSGQVRQRRDLGITSFTSCSDDSFNVLMRCPGHKIGARCNFFRSDQRYWTYSGVSGDSLYIANEF